MIQKSKIFIFLPVLNKLLYLKTRFHQFSRVLTRIWGKGKNMLIFTSSLSFLHQNPSKMCKNGKSKFQPAFGVLSTQTLLEIYNTWLISPLWRISPLVYLVQLIPVDVRGSHQWFSIFFILKNNSLFNETGSECCHDKVVSLAPVVHNVLQLDARLLLHGLGIKRNM